MKNNRKNRKKTPIKFQEDLINVQHFMEKRVLEQILTKKDNFKWNLSKDYRKHYFPTFWPIPTGIGRNIRN